MEFNVDNENFPEIFITGKLPNNYSKNQAILDGLMGFELRHKGKIIPSRFDEGMKVISTLVGKPSTYKNFLMLLQVEEIRLYEEKQKIKFILT